MKKLNFAFPTVRNIEETKAKHSKKVLKLKQLIKDRNMSHLIGNELLSFNEIDYGTFQAYDVGHSYERHAINRKKDQAQVLQIKKLVNNVARVSIQFLLKKNDLPASYDTAFYLLDQKYIDRNMMKATKELYKTING